MVNFCILCSGVVDLLFIVTPIVGVRNCSMFCCTLLYVNLGFAITLMGKRELVSFAHFVVLVPHDCYVTLPRGATCLSTVCDCGIS